VSLLKVPVWQKSGLTHLAKVGDVLRLAFRPPKASAWRYAAARLAQIDPGDVDVVLTMASLGAVRRRIGLRDPHFNLFWDPDWSKRYARALPVFRVANPSRSKASRPRAKRSAKKARKKTARARGARTGKKRKANPPGLARLARKLPASLIGGWGGERKPNPSGGPGLEAELAKARRTFERWQGSKARRVLTVHNAPAGFPPVVVKLGTVPEIVYRSTKWGETDTYSHRVEGRQPMLVTDPEGKQLYILGGDLKVTERGLTG